MDDWVVGDIKGPHGVFVDVRKNPCRAFVSCRDPTEGNNVEEAAGNSN